MLTNPQIRPLIRSFLLSVCLLFGACAKKEKQLHATLSTSLGTIVVRLLEEDAPKTVENFVGLVDGSKLLEEGADPSDAKPFYDGLTFHRVIPDFMIQGGDPQGDGSGGPGYTFEDETYTPAEPLTGAIPDLETAQYVFEQLIAPHLREHQGQSPVPYIAELYGEMQQAQGFKPLLDVTMEELMTALDREEPLLGKGELINSVDYGTLCMANRGPDTNGSQFFIVTREGGVPNLNGRHTVFGRVIEGMDVVKAIADAPKELNSYGEMSKPIDPIIINTIRVDEVRVAVEE